MEHIPKNQVISLLQHFKNSILNKNGQIYISVPNAQSNTGCYWAYEDFTHETLYTTGSLLYILKMAGFNQIDFLDIEGLENTKGIKKMIKRFFLKIYKHNVYFWNKVTSSSFHHPSPQCFCYELKVLAK